MAQIDRVFERVSARTSPACWLALLLLISGLAPSLGQDTNTNATPENAPANGDPSATNAAPATNSVDSSVAEVQPPDTTNAPAAGTNIVEETETEPPAKVDLSDFQVRPGFRLEVVATEPLVYAPSAMAFDANGRLFVTEMRDYPDRRNANPHLGRVRMLEDTDNDGTFDSATVIAENLAWPSGIACFNEGVFVATTPDIVYLKDTSGGSTASVHSVVFTGFGNADYPSPERLIGSLTWGPDLRVHGLAAGLSGDISTPMSGEPGRTDIYNQDFSFDPRTLRMQAEAGPGLSALSFDQRGRKYVTQGRVPVEMAMRSPAYYGRNPTYAPPPELQEVLRPATPIFPFTSTVATNNEPKRTAAVRTGPATTNLVSSTWLRSPSALLIYRGSAFPPAFMGNAFVADPNAGVIHRAVLRDSDLAVVATRAPDETATEFLRSRDPAFKPRDLAVGPDGALYVADLREGGNAGRIYRIVPAGFKQSAPARLAKASTRELVASLAQTNSWQRETAARLLWERQDPAARDLLFSMVQNSRLPLARLEAARLLTALGFFHENWLSRALRDTDERVRVQALQAVEAAFPGGEVSDLIWGQIQALTTDPSIHVRHQLALTLGSIRRDERSPILAALIRRDPANIYMQGALLSSLGEVGGPVFLILANDGAYRNSQAGDAFLRTLATMFGTAGQASGVSAVINWAADTTPRNAVSIVTALAEGLRRNGNSLARVDAARRLQPLYAEALLAGLNRALPDAQRIQALQFVGVGPYTYPEAAELLLLLPGSSQPPAIQTAAVAALGRYNTPAVLTNLFARWNSVAPGLQPAMISAALAGAERVSGIASMLRAGGINPNQLTYQQANMLRFYPNPDITDMVTNTLGELVVNRSQVRQAYAPALRLRGVPDNGRRIFNERCAACHRFGREGNAVGPDLTGVKVYGKEALVTAILEPNLQVREEYETWFLQTTELENYVGIVEMPYPTTVVLRRPGGARITMMRGALGYIQRQPWTLMPNGLEQGLSTQQFADLLEFLMLEPR